MKPLRFCMVTTFYPPYNFGGDGIGVQRLAQALVRQGHAVTVVHDVDAYRVLGASSSEKPPGGDDGVEIVGLRSRLGALSPVLAHQTGRPSVHETRLRKILDTGRYDVIHFHNISLMGGPGVLSLGNALKVYTAHEHWLVCPTHVLWRHDREPCTARECTRCVLRSRRPPQLWRYTGSLERQLHHVDIFIALSEFSRRMHHTFGFRRNMEVLPHFLPTPDPANTFSDDRSPHERPYFLFVGRLERIKGLDDVLPIFRAEGDVDLLVAGDGSHAGELKRQAGGSPRVRFLGRVDLKDLPRYYRHALAVIVPSIGFETFGMTLIEALREGTPVLARRLGPFPEIVELSQAGLLFSSRAELLESMHRIQSDAGLRGALRVAARTSFNTFWSEEAVLPRYLQLVSNGLLGQNFITAPEPDALPRI